MKKFVLMILGLLCLSTAALAAENLKVRVVPKAGDALLFEFDQKPEIAFNNGGVTITAKDVEAVTYDFEEIDRIEMITTTEVGSIADEIEATVTVAAYPDRVTFRNVPEGATVAVYNLSGNRVALDRTEGEYTLYRNDLPWGIYIVKINQQSFKISI